MSFKLKTDESILGEAKLHWSAYLVPGIWAAMMLMLSTSLISQQTGSAIFFAIVGVCPVFYRFLQSKMNKYIVTNLRFYYQEGVLSRKIVEIPIGKINDVGFKQNFIQLIFGSGNVTIMSGNDAPVLTKSISGPAHFKESITSSINKKDSSAAKVNINIA